MIAVDLSHFIGSWYYTGEKVGLEKVISDLKIIDKGPDQFNFTFDMAMDRAVEILGTDRGNLEWDYALSGFSGDDDEMSEV